MRSIDGMIGIVGASLGLGAVILAASGSGNGWWVFGFAATSIAILLYVLVAVIVTPRVLLVGDPDGPNGGRMGAMTQALDDAGFGVRSCTGPSHHRCPVLDGEPCPVHGHPSAVVVFHPATYSGPVPPCGEALHVPELDVEDGSAHEPELNGRTARVGAERGPAAAVETLRALLDRSGG